MIAPLKNEAPPTRGASTGRSGAGAGWKADGQRSVATGGRYTAPAADGTPPCCPPSLLSYAITQLDGLGRPITDAERALLAGATRSPSFCQVLYIIATVDTLMHERTGAVKVALLATKRALIAATIVGPDGGVFAFLLGPGQRAIHRRRLLRFCARHHVQGA
jgi:hypothetical protein